MSTEVEPVAGQKRGPGRPPKNSTPAAKKPKLASPVQQTSPAVQSPAVSTPMIEKRSTRLPTSISDNKPLPTLAEPQLPKLSPSDYQSIAASAVLEASIARSQARWTCQGIFERYWVKPETGKNARAPPPNNPDPKWMKHKGECRVRIEPHIFECQMYLEERPKPPPPPKQFPAPTSQSPYGQPYTPQQAPYQQPYAPQQQNQYAPNRALPSIRQAQPQQSRLPMNNVQQRTPSIPTPQPARPQPTAASPAQQGQKSNPDPVIARLATRASSDPELKALMKEVAAGHANPEQLSIFQKHIDQLQKQIKAEKEAEDKKEREEEEAKAQAQTQAEEESIKYDGAAESRVSTPTPVQYPQQKQYTPQSHAHPQPYPTPQPTQTPYTPPPGPPAVVLSFSTPGASEDRFLFPRNAILERLSDHHYLASFIVTRRGREAADPTGLDPDTEYWQPVTMMLEVKYGLEFLVEYVKKWVRPAEEVAKDMKEIMTRCTRAPETHLALRLPVKSGAVSETDDSGVSKEATPVVIDERPTGKRKSVKYVKPPLSVLKKRQSIDAQATPTAVGAGKRKGSVAEPKTPAPAPATVMAEKEQKAAADQAADGATESGRPKRSVRKSVRISEG